ncbi:MAG: TetR/AcrR family transcriptional regulator [Chloroflexota bacterium]
MAAALRLFGTKGYGAVGIREIALEAGISTAALYHYMRTKEDLLVALMTDRMSRIIASGRAATAGLEAPEQKLVALVRVHVLAHGHYPETVIDQEVRSLSAEARPAVLALRDEYENIWRAVADTGAAEGVFEVPSAQTARLALLEMCNGVVTWYRPGGPLPLSQIADDFAELALAMVGANRDGRRLRLRELGLPPIASYEAIVAEQYQGMLR